MKSIRKFNSLAEYSSAMEEMKGLDNYLALTIGEDGQPILDRKMPEKLRALKFTTDGTAIIGMTSDTNMEQRRPVNLQYSMDGKSWNEWDLSGITINEGDTLYIRGDNSNGLSYHNVESGSYCYYMFSMEGDRIYSSGNIMHLLDYTKDSTSIPCPGCFERLFSDCTSLVNAPELPATALEIYCYSSMFRRCSSLVNAPALPATVLERQCYSNMFMSCSSLVTAPALPATTLTDNCYTNMFNGCTSLVTAPALPATTLKIQCYTNMFRSCTSLVNAPELPATTLEIYCYQNMFNGCTSLVNAPELPATTLQMSCYTSMFNGCSKLQSITCLYEKSDLFNYTYSWVKLVPSGGTFYTCANPQWNTAERGESQVPEGWIVTPKVA